jgi:hypothetical protein
VKVTGIKTDSANGAIQSVSGDAGGSMTVTTLAGGGTAADDITAGDAAVEITTPETQPSKSQPPRGTSLSTLQQDKRFAFR